MRDELVKGKKPNLLLAKGGVRKQLTKPLVERPLESEMTTHLGYEKNSSDGKNTGNSRNGKTTKQVEADFGGVGLEVPRDRSGEFERQLVKKGQRRVPGFDDKVIAPSARGMSTREIQSHLHGLHGVEVSPTLVSNVTDTVLDEASFGRTGPWKRCTLCTTKALTPNLFCSHDPLACEELL